MTRPMRFQAASRFLILPLSLFLAGCGGADGPDLGTVTGKVTLDGQPVSRAVITFTPEKGPPSYGGSNAEGQYRVFFTADKTGAVIGRHSVTIEQGNVSTDDNGKPLPDQNITKIPKKYAGKAGALSVDVKPGDNVIDLALDSK